MSCRNGTCWYSEATPASGRGRRVASPRPCTFSTTWRRCSGVVPQQPPTRARPKSLVKWSWAAASCSGVSGYDAPSLPSIGSPALGMHDRIVLACRDRWRRCSLISSGPVAQFSPRTSIPNGSSAVRAAPISLPSSIVPVVSTVTWHISAASDPAAFSARFAPITAALACSRSWAVSTRTACDAAGEHAAHLCLVRVAQRGVRHVTQGGELGAGADGTDHPARLVLRAPVVGHLAGDPGAGLGQLLDPRLDAVLRQVGQVGAERVGLDRVDARVEVGLVHAADDVRPGDVEDLVAALVTLEVVHRGVLGLQHGPHRPVGDDDAGGQGLPEAGCCARHAGAGHRGRV